MGSLNKDKHLSPGRWVWVVQNESKTEQHRTLGIFLDRDSLGDAWVAISLPDGTFEAGQYGIGDLIPLNNCTGWNYSP